MSHNKVLPDEVPRANSVFLFRLAVTKIFDNIAESVSEEDFIRIMTILKNNSSICRKMHKAMIEELRNGMHDDLKEVFEEGTLEEALQKVAKLTEETNIPVDEKAWRPPGDVQLHLRSFDAEKMEAECERLEKLVNDKENENESLMKKLVENRAQVCTMNDRITQSLHCIPAVLQRLETQLEQLQYCFKLLEDD